MIRRPPRSTRVRSSAASDVYKRQFYRLAVFINFCFYFPIPDNFGILATSVLFWENSAPQVFSATQPPRCGRLRMQFFFGASPDAISFIFVVCAFPWSRQHYVHTSKAHHCSPVRSSILYASGSPAVCFLKCSFSVVCRGMHLAAFSLAPVSFRRWFSFVSLVARFLPLKQTTTSMLGQAQPKQSETH